MLEICKNHAYTTKGRVRLGICISTIFIVAMVFGLLVMARPYAVYADGGRVTDAWVVKVDGRDVAVVDSETSGKAVVDGVKAAYVKSVAQLEQTDIGKDVKIEKYQFKGASDHPVIMTAPEAVKHVVNLNAKGVDSGVAVEDTKVVEENVPVPYTTETVDSYQYYEGRTSVQVVGVNGENKVTSQVKLVNGKEVSRTVVKTEVVAAPVTEVIAKGTYPKPSETTAPKKAVSSSAATSRPAFNPTGNSVVDFALQFLGTRYIWGGTSLTGGIDCSGFTQAVYARFGVSLPHSSYAQRSCGVGVSYSDARPGDLICYSGHVALYMGNGKVVHANGYSNGVQISDATYNTILAVRRVI